jgi:hypothetical protein
VIRFLTILVLLAALFLFGLIMRDRLHLTATSGATKGSAPAAVKWPSPYAKSPLR